MAPPEIRYGKQWLLKAQLRTVTNSNSSEEEGCVRAFGGGEACVELGAHCLCCHHCHIRTRYLCCAKGKHIQAGWAQKAGLRRLG